MKKPIIISLVAVVLLIFLFFATFNWAICEIFGSKIPKQKIISKYIENSVEFKLAYEEIKNTKFSNLRFNGDYTILFEYINKAGQIVKIIDDETLEKYKKVIKMSEKFNIETVSKSQCGNVKFEINFLPGLVQYISYIENYDIYIKDTPISFIEKIEGNWYYVEMG